MYYNTLWKFTYDLSKTLRSQSLHFLCKSQISSELIEFIVSECIAIGFETSRLGFSVAVLINCSLRYSLQLKKYDSN